jgi:thiamine biosynthesis protein ThiI
VFDCILVHYGELGLKGQNRPIFEKKLIENIGKALKEQKYGSTKKAQARIILELNEKSNTGKIEESLKRVFGIAWFAFVCRTEPDLESVKNLVGKQFRLAPGTKARVSAKRAEKTLPFTSMDADRELGTYLVNEFNAKISLNEPETTIFIEFAQGSAYVFDRKIRGPYGLPVGVSGKVLHLLSGGLDSPVAAWLLMKRGCPVEFLHFHAFRKFDKDKNSKILNLVDILKQYCFKSRVFFVPFYPFEAEAVEAPERYRLILFRRFMFRVAEQVAKKHGIDALSSGENLAQVSSQTLENMALISRATSMTMLRPLLTYEKDEIVRLARQIGTFEISTRMYKDCCQLFMAKHPATRAKLQVVESIEKKLNLSEAISESLDKTEIVNVE